MLTILNSYSINNMDNMHISGNEISSVILSYLFKEQTVEMLNHRVCTTRVSVETGALLVYSCLITYKRLSQRYQVNMMIYKGVIVNMTSSSYRLNASSHPLIGSMQVL